MNTEQKLIDNLNEALHDAWEAGYRDAYREIRGKIYPDHERYPEPVVNPFPLPEPSKQVCGERVVQAGVDSHCTLNQNHKGGCIDGNITPPRLKTKIKGEIGMMASSRTATDMYDLDETMMWSKTPDVSGHPEWIIVQKPSYISSSSTVWPPEGYEIVPGRCPNVGHACNCIGLCQSTLKKIEE